MIKAQTCEPRDLGPDLHPDHTANQTFMVQLWIPDKRTGLLLPQPEAAGAVVFPLPSTGKELKIGHPTCPSLTAKSLLHRSSSGALGCQIQGWELPALPLSTGSRSWAELRTQPLASCHIISPHTLFLLCKKRVLEHLPHGVFGLLASGTQTHPHPSPNILHLIY